jgi:predicted DNA-binding transcriptional regulator YafY
MSEKGTPITRNAEYAAQRLGVSTRTIARMVAKGDLVPMPGSNRLRFGDMELIRCANAVPRLQFTRSLAELLAEKVEAA